MKLTDDLPAWVAIPLRLLLYVFVMFILYNIAVAVVVWQIRSSTQECAGLAQARQERLEFARSMVGCLRQKNNFAGNLLMRPIYHAIDAMPNAPKEFVGTWIAEQPRCSYKHTLGEDGRFVSEPHGCSLSNTIFHGTWGVFKGQMIWLQDENIGVPVWPPDINKIDVVDPDFFLLTELDGTRTRFTRVKDVVESQPVSSVDLQGETAPLEEAADTADLPDPATLANEPDGYEEPLVSEEPRMLVEPDVPHAVELPEDGALIDKAMIPEKPDEPETMPAPYGYRK